MQIVLRNITLEMNKFTEDECLPSFQLKCKFIESLSEPLTLKSTRKRIEEKKQNGRDEGSKPNDSSCRGKPSKPRERKSNGYEKSQASTPENHTIVANTDDELVSFRDIMVSKSTKKVQVHQYTVCSLGSTKNTANKLISMQFRSKKHRSFSNTSS